MLRHRRRLRGGGALVVGVASAALALEVNRGVFFVEDAEERTHSCFYSKMGSIVCCTSLEKQTEASEEPVVQVSDSPIVRSVSTATTLPISYFRRR